MNRSKWTGESRAEKLARIRKQEATEDPLIRNPMPRAHTLQGRRQAQIDALTWLAFTGFKLMGFTSTHAVRFAEAADALVCHDVKQAIRTLQPFTERQQGVLRDFAPSLTTLFLTVPSNEEEV